MQFRGGELDPKTGRRPMVRTKLLVQTKVRKTIHDDAEFYVTTQGVLGEQFLAIEPGSPNHPVLDPETVIPKGVGPPRLDLFFAKAYELLDMTVTGLNNNKDLVKDIAFDGRPPADRPRRAGRSPRRPSRAAWGRWSSASRGRSTSGGASDA